MPDSNSEFITYLSSHLHLSFKKVNDVSIEKLKVESHQELEQMIPNELGQIDKGLTVICTNVPINEKTTLDILCYDSEGQLVIVQLSINEDDFMLLSGLQSLDYVDKFKSFLQATYNKHAIDANARPRLILIAPRFSDALLRAVDSMRGLSIDLYEWEYLKLGDNKGFRLQPAFTWRSTEKPREDKPAERRSKKKEHEPEPIPVWRPEPTPEPAPELEPPQEESPPPLDEAPPEPPKKKMKLF
jgi:hypothetical protein